MTYRRHGLEEKDIGPDSKRGDSQKSGHGTTTMLLTSNAMSDGLGLHFGSGGDAVLYLLNARHHLEYVAMNSSDHLRQRRIANSSLTCCTSPRMTPRFHHRDLTTKCLRS